MPLFRDIVDMLSRPRRQGRTYTMLSHAPHGATIMAVDSQHETDLKRMALECRRPDLRFLRCFSDELRGHYPTHVLFDHHTIERLMASANLQICQQADIIARQKDEVAMWQARYETAIARACVFVNQEAAPGIWIISTEDMQAKDAKIADLEAEVRRLSTPILMQMIVVPDGAEMNAKTMMRR